MSKEESVTGGGPPGIPRPIGSRSYVSSWGGNHEYKLHCEGQSDEGHLHGHGNQHGWESGPEQETSAQGPKIEDITDLIWEVAR